MTFIVKTSNLWKSYGDKKALVGVSLHIPEGEIYGLLGPNGAGKTSIIGIISGILRFDKGNFSIAGKKHVSQIKNLVGLVPQDAQLYYDMTCLNHLIFFAKLQGFNIETSPELISDYKTLDADNALNWFRQNGQYQEHFEDLFVIN